MSLKMSLTSRSLQKSTPYSLPQHRRFKRRKSFLWLVPSLLLFWGIRGIIWDVEHNGILLNTINYRADHLDKMMDEPEARLNRKLLTMNVVRPGPQANCTPLAVENFPTDIFTQKQRRQGVVLLHLFAALYYFIALALTCDEYFIPCMERICECLHLQPDVAGATFMAAGSSAPELATTLVGVFVAKDDIGLGAVVGSADFNVMLVISLSALFAKEVIYLNWWPLVRDSTVYLLSIVLITLIILDEHVYWYEALFLLLGYVFYVVLMYFNPRIDAFWRSWCQAHPTCCPRAIHSHEEEMKIAQQRTGAFGHIDMVCATDTGGITALVDNKRPHLHDASVMRPIDNDASYQRLESSPPASPGAAHHTTTLSMDQVENKDYRDAILASGDELKLQESVHPEMTSQQSWFDAVFGSLRLPSHVGTRGKIMYVWALFLWPIRLCLCFTVPDVRHPMLKSSIIAVWVTFVMSCFWIGLFTTGMIWMITVIGVTVSIPDTIMGLTFIAAGSSMPDAISSVLVVREGEGDMAVSNAVGSNIFDILVCMGLPWFMKAASTQTPVLIYSRGLTYSTITLLLTVVFLLGVTHLNRWRLTKLYGVVLFIGYVVVLVFCSLYELNYFGVVHLPSCLLVE